MDLKELYEFIINDERNEFDFKPIEDLDDWTSNNRVIFAHPSLQNKEEAKTSPKPNIYMDLDEKVNFGISYSDWSSLEPSFVKIVSSKKAAQRKKIVEIISSMADYDFHLYKKDGDSQSSTDYTSVYQCKCNEIDAKSLDEIVAKIKEHREEWSDEASDNNEIVPSIDLARGSVSLEDFESFDFSSFFKVLNNLFSMLTDPKIKKTNAPEIRRIKSELRPIEKEITVWENKKLEKEQWIEKLIEREAKPEPINYTKENISLIEDELQPLYEKRNALLKESEQLSI